MTRNHITSIAASLVIVALIGIGVLSTANTKQRPIPTPSAPKIFNDVNPIPAFRSEVASVRLSTEPSNDGTGTLRAILRNVGNKAIAYLVGRTAVERDSFMSMNFMVANGSDGLYRDFGPLKPQEVFVIRGRATQSIYVVTAVAYTDGTTEGFELDKQFAGSFVKSWKQALAPYDQLIMQGDFDRSDAATIMRSLNAKAAQELHPDRPAPSRGKGELDDWINSIIDGYANQSDKSVATIRRMIKAARELHTK